MQQVTIGRRLYFRCVLSIIQSCDINLLDPEQPCDAGVIFVHSEGKVNVLVTDHCGFQHVFEDIPLVTDEDHDHSCWVEWMPYQIKAEAERVARETLPTDSDSLELN